MKRKKILVHGTLASLNNFFSDAVSRDYEVIALLSEEPEKISVTRDGKELEVFTPQNLPGFTYELADEIIITDAKGLLVKFFLSLGISPRKIVLWDVKEGWLPTKLPDSNGKETTYLGGLEFHIRDDSDERFFKQTVNSLKTNRRYKNMEPNQYVEVAAQDFQKRRGKPLDLDNPKTFTEKLKWMIFFDATPLKSRLADKYLVRYWVEEKIGGEYLIPLLGVWDDFDDINFDELPDQFVLKCNHGCAMNIIVRDKKSFDKQRAREKINAWLAIDFAATGLEPHYTRIDRKIIAEKFMANGDLPDLIDYKFLCIDGKVIYCQYLTDRSTKLKLNYFDTNWKITGVERSDHPRSDNPENIPKPKNFELMKELAAKLAEEFNFVRVDFYEIDGKVYFGEMTFTPAAGNFYYKSEGTDEYLGGLLNLPVASAPPVWNFHT